MPLLGIEDRDNANQVPWAWYYGQTEADVTTHINAGLRIVDLKVENPTGSPKTFTVAFVSNTGTFARTWYWNYDQTASDAFNFAVNNNLRPIVIQGYETSPGTVRFANVWISNTGVYAKGWWVYPALQISEIGPTLTTNNARLTQISRYTTGGQTYLAVIMIPNTGGDQKAWWWYTGHTVGEIVGYVNTNNARVTDLDYDAASGTYSAIMEGCGAGCPGWWYYFGLDAAGVGAALAQDTARPIDISRCGAGCYSVVFVIDADAITARVGELMRDGTAGTGATTGLYLKRVGGPVLATMEQGYVFDPASTLKIGIGTLAMTKVQAGTAALSDQITRNTDGPESCPNPAHTGGTDSLQTAIQEMMRHSDNARTLEIETWDGGAAAVNTFMHGAGMTSSNLNGIIGCANPLNDYTLHDGGVIYEGIANGSLLDSTHETSLFSMMAGKAEVIAEGYDFTHVWDTDFPSIVAAEKPAQMSDTNRDWWYDHANVAYKAGGYVLCPETCTDVFEDIAISGWASLPFCSGLTVVPHEFVWGMFISNAEDPSYYSGKTTLADSTFNTTKSEVLREQIRASLASCLHGDATGNGALDITDIFYLINSLFASGPPPVGWADMDGNGILDIADVFYGINFLFAGGPKPK
jgi:hypothetical protein